MDQPRGNNTLPLSNDNAAGLHTLAVAIIRAGTSLASACELRVSLKAGRNVFMRRKANFTKVVLFLSEPPVYSPSYQNSHSDQYGIHAVNRRLHRDAAQFEDWQRVRKELIDAEEGRALQWYRIVQGEQARLGLNVSSDVGSPLSDTVLRSAIAQLCHAWSYNRLGRVAVQVEARVKQEWETLLWDNRVDL